MKGFSFLLGFGILASSAASASSLPTNNAWSPVPRNALRAAPRTPSITRRSEPHWRGFNTSEELVRLYRGWRDSMILADMALQVIEQEDYWLDRYFYPHNWEDVRKVFRRIAGPAGSYRGSPILHRIQVLPGHKFSDPAACERAAAFVSTADSRIYLCKSAFRTIDLDDLICGDHPAVPLGQTLLHEYLHTDLIGPPAIGRQITDSTYGPFPEDSIDKKDSIVNADAYSAQDIYLDWKCFQIHMHNATIVPPH